MDFSVDPAGTRTENTYDPANANLTQTLVLSAAGVLLQKTTYDAYDGRGNPTKITRWNTDAAGTFIPYVSTINVYDPAGRLTETREENAAGVMLQKSTFTYDHNGNTLTSSQWKKDAAGVWGPWSTTTNRYDLQNRLVKTISPLGAVTRTIYNDDGQVAQTIDADAKATQTKHDDPMGQVTSTIDRLGNTTSYKYDAAGRVVETVYPDTTVTRTVYDALGRAVATVDRYTPASPDAGANGTRTVYDERGRVEQTQRVPALVISVAPDVQNPLLYTSTVASQGTPLPAAVTTYDIAGRVIGSTGTDGQTTNYKYDPAGRQSTVIQPEALDTEEERNGGLEVRVRATTQTAYDALGRQSVVTDPYGRQTTFTYDGLGRQTKTTYDDGTFITTAYDELGRKVAETDQVSLTTEYRHDEVGNLTAVIQPPVVDAASGQTVNPTYEYEYDPAGNMLVQRDALGRETIFTYDSQGRRLTRKLPDVPGQAVATEVTIYDTFGRTDKHTDFKGNQHVYIYDMLGRVDEERYFAPGVTTIGTPGIKIDYVYDALSRQDQVIETRGSIVRNTDYDYDGDGRVMKVVSPEGTINYAYDPATGRLTGTTTPTGTNTGYTYDEHGRLKTVAALGGTTTYGYDRLGNQEQVALPNGVITDYDFDPLYRLDLETVAKGAVTLASYDYTVRDDGQRTALAETRRNDNGTLHSTVNVQWQYDNLKRLTQETFTSSLAGQSYAAGYDFDPVGNRLKKTQTGAGAATTTSTFNPRDQLTQELTGGTPTTYQYDANGSQVERKVGTQAADTYVYDLRNSLTGAAVAGVSSTYVYDHAGSRVSKTVSGQITHHLVDLNNPTGYSQVLEESATAGGTPSRRYVLGQDVIAQAAGTTVQYLMYDGHGSNRGLLSASGLIVTGQRYDYDAFGNALPSNPASPGTTLLYAGEQWDAEKGSYFLRGRPAYDPRIGRFTNGDPRLPGVGDLTNANLYVYVGNNAINLNDPSGHEGIASQIVTNALARGLVALETSIAFGMTKLALAPAGVLLAGRAGIAAYTLYKFTTDEDFRNVIYANPNPHQVIAGEATALLSSIRQLTTTLPTLQAAARDMATIRSALNISRGKSLAFVTVQVDGQQPYTAIAESGTFARAGFVHAPPAGQALFPTPSGYTHHADNKLFEMLGRALRPGATGTARLFVDHPEGLGPCNSCASVIARFGEAFPGVAVTVTYKTAYSVFRLPFGLPTPPHH